jgi:hypothetical protein
MIKQATLVLLVLGALLPEGPASAAGITLVTDSAPGRSVRHGLGALERALRDKGVSVERSASIDADRGKMTIVAGLSSGPGKAAALAAERKLEAARTPESLLVRRLDRNGAPILLVTAVDDRGLMYALLDVADRIGWARADDEPLREVRDTTETPHVRDRALSIYTMHRATFEGRFFDEAYWDRYFDMLARDRFNAFVLIFGYENGGYFAPAYPYFFDVEGFPEVRVVDFTPDEQSAYLRALNRMVDQAHARGLQFRVGLWDHIYRGGVQSGGVKDADPARPLPGVPTGLSKRNLAAYSTTALAKFLTRVPGIDGVQLRMHSESGLEPGLEMFTFWKQIYGIIRETRPGLLVDARAKEFPDALIDLALEMGINLRISTKYWAEQMGLPFHPTHVNRQNQHDRRHGYADLLRYPRRYSMDWQLWTGGTTRILLWGDPEYARRFAASTHLYDGDGFEVNEPLATKMEAQPHQQAPFELLGARDRYYDYEFERYWHFYQVFGRLGYNPGASPETWQREFARRFGAEAAPALEAGLHRASGILPRIIASTFPYQRFPTTRGWVEKQRWEDLPAYARIEGSDTQQFQSFHEAVRGRLEGIDSAKLSPERNSAWFDRAAADVLAAAATTERALGPRAGNEARSTLVDLRILAHLARYHARRIEAGLAYALFTEAHDVNALDDAVTHERQAVAAWTDLVAAAGDVYAGDLMMGLRSAGLSGHWRDELVELRRGLLQLEERLRNFAPQASDRPRIAHAPVRRAVPGDDLVIRATAWGPSEIRAVRAMWQLPGQAPEALSMEPAGPQAYRLRLPPAQLVDGAAYTLWAEDSAGRRAAFPADDGQGPIRVGVSDDREPPTLVHRPIERAAAGKPLRVRARVHDPSGVLWVRLLHRGVTQFQDYRRVEMRPAGRDDEYEAVVPGEQVEGRWDFMYLFEVMDRRGNGKIYPDFEVETPYIVVPLDR